MRKKYDVTDDMLQKLHAGQEFKSFAELSRTLGVLDSNGKPLTSDSRKQFMEELDRFVEYRKEDGSQKITIVKVRPPMEIKPPRPTSGKNSKYSSLIQRILTFQLLRILDEWKCESAELLFEADSIFFACGMIRRGFAFCEIHTMKEFAAKQFRSLCRSKFNEYTVTALNAMQRNKELSWTTVKYLVKGRRPNRKIQPLKKDERDKLLQLEDETFQYFSRNNGCKYKDVKELFASGKRIEYYNHLNSKIAEEFLTSEEKERDVLIKIETLYLIDISQKNIERLKARVDWNTTPFDSFDKLNALIYEYIKTSKRMKSGVAIARKNKKKVSDGQWGNPNKMLKDYNYFKNALTQEQIDEFADEMIKLADRVVIEENTDSVSLPPLRPTIFCKNVVDDLDDADFLNGVEPEEDNSIFFSDEDEENPVEQPEDEPESENDAEERTDNNAASNSYQKDFPDFQKMVALYQNYQKQLQKNRQKEKSEEIDIATIIDEI